MDNIALLNVSKHTKATLWRNQTAYDFLGNVLCRCTQKILKLDRAEFLNDGGLLLNTVLESRLKFVKLAFLFVQVLNEAASAFLHLIQAALQADPVGRLIALSMLDLIIGDWVL